jgi:hypothetical protein
MAAFSRKPLRNQNEGVAADVNRLIILRAIFRWSGLTSAVTQNKGGRVGRFFTAIYLVIIFVALPLRKA